MQFVCLLRCGWARRSFSRKQPMTPQQRKTDRNLHYTAGVLVSSGIAIPGSEMSRMSPGPGYYGGPVVSPVSTHCHDFNSTLQMSIYIMFQNSKSHQDQIQQIHSPRRSIGPAAWEHLGAFSHKIQLCATESCSRASIKISGLDPVITRFHRRNLKSHLTT